MTMDGRRDGTHQTDPVALRAALGASEARFRSIIEKNADGVIVVSFRGTVRFVNPAAVDLLGRRAEELIGSHFGVPVVPGETTEVDIPRSAGEVRIAELRVVETEWDDEHALLVSLRDISERKRLEEQMRQKANALAEADRRKDEFLAMLGLQLGLESARGYAGDKRHFR
jgi:PAS domain-containing protein